MILFVLALLTEPPPPKYDACAEECEALEMSFVREHDCVCVCWDPADRAYFVTDNPECIGEDVD